MQSKLKECPKLEIRLGRELPDSHQLKTLLITKRGNRIYANLVYAVPSELLPESDSIIGIDMGVTDRLTLSNGGQTRRRKTNANQIKRKQQRLARCKKDSREYRRRRRILANAHYRERVRNRNECHEITTELIRNHGTIAIEDLIVTEMTKSSKGQKKRSLNRGILEQTWGMMRQQLSYKAEWAGRALIVVNPAYTSQTCSGCGTANKGSRKGKAYKCVECGMVKDADVNAAINILNRAMAGGNNPVAVTKTA